MARQLGPKLGERLKQTVVVDNRGGGGGSIGAELTARAAPDGYTLMMASSAFLIRTLLYPASYHPIKDFAPVTQLVKHPYVMVVASAVPARSVADFIAWAKANPDRVNYASSGSGSLIHLTGELFKAKTGTAMTHIPYKGIAPGLVDMFSGRVQVTFASVATTLPHIKAGRLRALGVTSVKRAAPLAEVPTLTEAGVKAFEVTQWFGVFAPVGTPAQIVARLQREIAAVLHDPADAQRMSAAGSEVVGNTPAEFARVMQAEYAAWRAVIRSANIRAE
ncbi:MAG TPA: tripartite tricarboxylate transporter substrate binding protein [Burkholderiales bacterium]|nr:tripartite tricarboxylate transporter substrate binding protein [Burkholderiales bacterium]